MIARVERLTPARSLRGPFDYRLVGALEDVGVGSMLVVPFGRRRLLGVVVDVSEESELPLERLAEPIAALEADVPQSLVTLGLWVAREYVSTRRAGSRWSCRRARAPALGGRRAPGARRAPRSPRPGEAALSEGARMGARQRGALEALASAPLGAAALARRTGCSHATLRSLERRGLLRLENAADPLRRPRLERVGARTGTVELTADQEAAFALIESRLEPGESASGERRPLLLHGVTGSGKTELYLRSSGRASAGAALLLVPEIALTPQLVGRFAARFGQAGGAA